MIKTLFIGTSEFAVPILETLINNQNINLVGVITQPDKPQGRKQILTPPPVKEFLSQVNSEVTIFQPVKLREEAQEILSQTEPELIIVASYGQMIPNNMLEYPKYKCLNIHASVLPILRGAVPIPMAILNGFKTSGITIQIMEEKMDVGDILGTKEFELDDNETTESLTKKSSEQAAELLTNILPDWFDGKITPIKQDDTKATYCYKADIAKENAELNSKMTAQDVDRMVRAFYPWPIAWGRLKSSIENKLNQGIEANEKFAGKTFKIYEGRVIDNNYKNKKGLKLFKHGKSLLLRCDIGWYEILECQVEGKNVMNGKEALFLCEDTTESVRGILRKGDKILLFHRKKGEEEYFSCPGGAIGVNENHEEALKREFKEETNLNIKVGEKVFETLDLSGVCKHHYYECSFDGDETDLRIVGEENQYDSSENSYELKWVFLSDLQSLMVAHDFNKHIKTRNL